MKAMENSTKTKALLKQLKKTIISLNRESKALVASYHKHGGLTQNKMKRYQDLQHFRAILEGVEGLIKEKNKQALLNMFGEHLEFLPLLFHCLYSSPFGCLFLKLCHRRRAIDEARNVQLFR